MKRKKIDLKMKDDVIYALPAHTIRDTGECLSAEYTVKDIEATEANQIKDSRYNDAKVT